MSYIAPLHSLILSSYAQNDCSEQFWASFLNLVSFCHDIADHKTALSEAQRGSRSSATRVASSYKRELKSIESRYFRARHLAAETVWKLVELAATSKEVALVELIVSESGLQQNLRSHETAQFSRFALTQYEF